MSTFLPTPPPPSPASPASPASAEPLLTLILSTFISSLAYSLVYRLVPQLGPDLVAKGLRGKDMLKTGFRRSGEGEGTGGASGKDGKEGESVREGEPGTVWMYVYSLCRLCRSGGDLPFFPYFHSSFPLPRLPYPTTLPTLHYLPPHSPEATGVIGASVYILLLSLFAPLPYLSSLLPSSFSSSLPSLNGTTLSNTLATSHPCQAYLLEGNLAFPHHSFATYLASLLSLLMATFLGFCDDVFDIRWRFKLPIPRAFPPFFS